MTISPRNREESGPRSTLPVFGPFVQPVRAVALAAALGAGCVKQLPPAPTPPAIAPAVDTSAPLGEGRGRLIVDVLEAPVPVHRVAMEAQPVDKGQGRVSFQFIEKPSVMCPAAPCVVDLPAGNVLLGFPVLGKDYLENELVYIGPETSVYRRSLSIYQRGGSQTFGILGASIGSASAITGMALLPVGLSKDNDAMAIAGGITLGVGAALIALGVWSMRANAATFRPGASHHFPLAPTGP